MNYQDAVKAYYSDPRPEILKDVIGKLVDQMSLKEKIYMLSGHIGLQMQKDLITTGRNYNVHALAGGGCKRLGIPPILFTDGPRGVVMCNSTCMPSAVMRASSFDPEVEYEVGKVIADEAIAQGANLFAGICINLLRNPRWGRSQESYGEDPFVLGEFGKALTTSVQEEGMIACVKHFALNSMEDLRFYVDVHIDDKSLYEVYLPHFKKCVDAGAECIMGAYNRYEEIHCCENKKLLTDILRKEWGFDGFVMSDFVWGVYDAEHSIRAGLDLEMMFTIKYSERNIRKCIEKGFINEEHLNERVSNIIRSLIRKQPTIKERDMSVVGSAHSRGVALKAAEKGMVLLENNGILPLDKDASIVVCGPYADVANTGDHGSSRVFDKKIVTPYQGLKNHFKNVVLAGCTENKNPKKDPLPVDNSVAYQSNGDVAVICVGFNYKGEGEYFVNTSYKLSEKPKDGGGDRLTLRLADEEIELIKGLKKAGKKTIVCLYSGSAILCDEWKEYADAIIMYYYGGCEGGTALANLLSGDKNFSGKIPFTVAQKEEDYPEFKYIGDKPYVIDYGYYHGYSKLDKENKKAAYPFGYGLSYTDFELNDISFKDQGDAFEAKVKVRNIGDRDGAQVVQVYLGSENKEIDRPVKLLKGFKRVELKAKEEKEISININKDELKFYDEGRWVLDKRYKAYVGTDCEDASKRVFSLDM
ncbi:MAG: glycoside hydrolase family 3 C-terminal domain-containing protein [Erysipelotrichaceae bacterium]|nr:glycoside hydrolase family 3 C-terminal domain-containing protein [Erysipelotrichaceae bacterium]